MNRKISFEDIEIKNFSKLGFGYMSEVFLGIHKRTNEKFAIKIINLAR
jgi:hypothetical protein